MKGLIFCNEHEIAQDIAKWLKKSSVFTLVIIRKGRGKLKHALVVGGTGMLSEVTLWLISQGYHVSIIARNAERMDKLVKRAGTKHHVTPLLVDYTDGKKLQEKLKNTISKNGEIDLVVAWIHSYATEALSIIIDEVSHQMHQWQLFHILGSRSNVERIRENLAIPNFCTYYQVQLGFIIDNGHSRWLTNEEISSGIIEAIKRKEKVVTIGQVEPREKRP